MPKRLARNPSTRSLSPARRNKAKAILISPAAIAHTMTGTARMRASVMRLGILKLGLGSRAAPGGGEAHQSFLSIAGYEPLRTARMCRRTPTRERGCHGRQGPQGPHLRRGRRRHRCRQPHGGADQALGARDCPARRRRRDRRGAPPPPPPTPRPPPPPPL